ncbi:hypothetical protein D3C87_265900 [compost metagenome]
MEEFYSESTCEENKDYSLIIEDDGRVAYAYLLFKNEIVGDLWLYNQKDAPLVVDWSDKNGMPFLNPKQFVLKEIPLIQKIQDIEIKWELLDDNILDKVLILIHGDLIGIIECGSRPGWSSLVTSNGPLAKRMS